MESFWDKTTIKTTISSLSPTTTAITDQILTKLEIITITTETITVTTKTKTTTKTTDLSY